MARKRRGSVASGLDAFERSFGLTTKLMSAYQDKQIRDAVKEGMTQAQAEADASGKSVVDGGSGDPNVADYQYANKADAASARATLNDVDSMQAEIDAQKAGKPVPAPTQDPAPAPVDTQVAEAGSPAAPPKSGLDSVLASAKPAMSVDPQYAMRQMSAVPAEGTTAPLVEPAQPEQSGRWQQIDKPQLNAMDIFHKKYAPTVVEAMMKQGKTDEATKFEAWSRSAQGQAYGDAWTKAVMLERGGDHQGAMMAVQDLYNKQMPDGQYATAVPGKDGTYTIEVRDEKTNKMVQQFAGKAPDLTQALLGMGSPDKVWSHLSALDAAKTKREEDLADAQQKHEWDVSLKEIEAGKVTPGSLEKAENYLARLKADKVPADDPRMVRAERAVELASTRGEGGVNIYTGASPDGLGNVYLKDKNGRIITQRAPGAPNAIDQANNALVGITEDPNRPGVLLRNGRPIAPYGPTKADYQAVAKHIETLRAAGEPLPWEKKKGLPGLR